MKKFLRVLFIFLTLVVLIVGAMFYWNICPPHGPWPTPPWCRSNFVIYNYDLEVAVEPLSQIKAVNMNDTWGRNYNMSMVETTQGNIDTSFDRLKAFGANEVYVHDFDRAIYVGETNYESTDYKLADETFWNDMRDESINEAELKKLVDVAHSRGMKLGIKRNLAFVNIGKFILSGLKGNISADVSSDYAKFNKSHSEEWIRDYFQKWQIRLIEKGRIYEKAGVDIMNISPTFQEPTFAGHEELANNLWKELIAELRKNFNGEIAVDFNIYGFNDGNNGTENWLKYDYYKSADIVEIKVYKVLEKYQLKNEQNNLSMQQEIESMIVDFDRKAGELGIKVSIFFAPSSYKYGIFLGPVEYLDVKNPAIFNLEKDYDAQANAFKYFFMAVKNTKNISRINVGNFAWDDAMDPEVRAKVSVSAGFRNKPAETVVKEWYLTK